MTKREPGTFACIPIAANRDRRLNENQRRVLFDLCTYGDVNGRCDPHIDTLSTNLDLNRRTVERAFKPLQEYGYLTVISGRGRNHKNSYIIHYLKCDNMDDVLSIDKCDTHTAVFNDGKCDNKSDVFNPIKCDNSDHKMRQPGCRTEQIEQNINTYTPLSPKGEICEEDISLEEKPVEKIYEAYPRKVGKAKALKAIQKALKKINFDELLAKVRVYAECPKVRSLIENGQKNFIPFPATWFNGERWTDEPEEWNFVPKEDNQQSNLPKPNLEEKRKNRIEAEIRERIRDINNWKNEDDFSLNTYISKREQSFTLHKSEIARASPLWPDYQNLVQPNEKIKKLPVANTG